MRLQVKNLGPIKQGEIDLSKHFYVFVGYNNSGKTYMSQLLWSLMEFWGERKNNNLNILMNSLSLVGFSSKYRTQIFTESDSIVLEKEQVRDILELYYNDIKDKIIDNFNINNEVSSFKNLQISFSNDIEIFIEQKISFNYGIKNEVFKFEKQANSLEINIEKSLIIKNSDDLRLNYTESGLLFDSLKPYFLFDFVTSIFHIEQEDEAKFFLPADRSFYASYYKYIYAALKDEMKAFEQALKKLKNGNELEYNYTSSYTSSVNSLIDSIYNLNLGNNKANLFYEDLIEDLQKVIGGDIVSRSSNPDIASLATFKLRMENKEELDMHLSSSSVNQLTTLYLYFKYWANEANNTLIIDEPEENLHPRNQIALLNILMKFANRNNNRVIITTHSPLLTDMVNNHLHLGYLANKYEKNIADLIAENNLDLDAAAALSHDDIGIYFFDGKSIKEYDVEEYGVDFKDFRKEQEKVEETGDVLRRLISKEKKEETRLKHQKLATTDV